MNSNRKNIIFLSVQPRFAEKILNGEKTVELRKKCPKLESGDLIILYVSSPVKSVCGILEVGYLLKKPVNHLWPFVQGKAGIGREEYEKYFEKKQEAFGIFLKNVWRMETPVFLSELKKMMVGFHPPQNFLYVKRNGFEVNKLMKIVEVNFLPTPTPET